MTKIEQKIPEGWSVKKLGECFQFLKTTSHSRGETQRSGEVHYIHYGDIHTKYNLHVSPSDIDLFISESQAEKGSLLQNGDLILLDASEDYEGTTKCIELSNICNEKIIAGLHTLALRDKNKNFSDGFRAYITSMPWVKSNFWKQVTGIKVYGISKENLSKLKLLLPPLPEQEKIAGILSCWDDGIEKLSALIEKKKIQKKALMQQLLTGKHRLKGFSTPWHEVKLGDVFSIKKGQGLSKEELNPLGKNACILYGELYTTYNEVIYNIKSLTNVDSGITSQVGDILIPASTTTTGIDLANATALMVSGVLLGGDINILRCKIQSSPIFFAYLLTHIYKYDIAKLAQGMTIVHLYGEFIKKIKVFIPSDLAEQKAIAEILSKADEEIELLNIELLNKKLEAFKQEKKALMQQLLTGKIRVKVN